MQLDWGLMAPILPMLTVCQKLAMAVLASRVAWEVRKLGYGALVAAACGLAVIGAILLLVILRA